MSGAVGGFPSMSTTASRASRSDTFHRRLRQEGPRLPDELAVGIDLALVPEVADQVPVQIGLILRAGFAEAAAERDVHGSPDLLVEQDVSGEPVDLVVQAERDLAEHR